MKVTANCHSRILEVSAWKLKDDFGFPLEKMPPQATPPLLAPQKLEKKSELSRIPQTPWMNNPYCLLLKPIRGRLMVITKKASLGLEIPFLLNRIVLNYHNRKPWSLQDGLLPQFSMVGSSTP